MVQPRIQNRHDFVICCQLNNVIDMQTQKIHHLFNCVIYVIQHKRIADIVFAEPDNDKFCSNVACKVPGVIIGVLLVGVLIATGVFKIRQYYR